MSAFHEALTLHRRGNLAAAERLYANIPAHDPLRPEAAANSAVIRMAQGDLSGAVTLASAEWLAQRGADWAIPIARGMGLTLYARGYWEAAQEYLSLVLDAQPGDQHVREVLRRITLRPDITPEHTLEDGLTFRRYAPREREEYQFIIDIVGTCNLRCPTCPVGNSIAKARPKGFMALDTYRAILDKIVAENAHRPVAIDLYNWGEPLLHPDLPEIIRATKAADLPVHLSTNLNVEIDFTALARANPTSIKISLSGLSAATYEITHEKGDFRLLKANMYRLRHALDKAGADTQIWAGFHRYRDNQHELAELNRICVELDYDLSVFDAYYMPAERVIDLIEGKVTAEEIPVLDQLLEDPRDRLKANLAQRADGWDCELRYDQTVINHDGSVALCCVVYDQENMLDLDFLDRPQVEIDDAKYRHAFCATCMKHGLNPAPKALPRAV